MYRTRTRQVHSTVHTFNNNEKKAPFAAQRLAFIERGYGCELSLLLPTFDFRFFFRDNFFSVLFFRLSVSVAKHTAATNVVVSKFCDLFPFRYG